MNLEWIYRLFTSGHDYLWDLYTGSSFYMKPIWLGVVSLLTQSQLLINLLLLIYFFILFKKADWVKSLILIGTGRIVGLFIGIGITTLFGDYYFQIILGQVNKSVGPLILLFLFLYFWVNKNIVLFIVKPWGAFIVGVVLSFYLDPVFYSYSRFLPFFFDGELGIFFKILLYSLVLIFPMTLFGLITYGFEIDQWARKKEDLYKGLKTALIGLFLYTAMISFYLYWF